MHFLHLWEIQKGKFPLIFRPFTWFWGGKKKKKETIILGQSTLGSQINSILTGTPDGKKITTTHFRKLLPILREEHRRTATSKK